MNGRKALWLSGALLFVSVAAHAGPLTFNLTIGGADSGNIAITETAGTINNITGTFDGIAIVALLPTGSIGINDNLFFTTPPYFDGGGVSFQLAALDPDGFGFVNISWNTVQHAYFSEQSATAANTGGVAFGPDTVTATPEPGSSSLILLGAGLAFAIRKYRLA
jgi:hypothetical protein